MCLSLTDMSFCGTSFKEKNWQLNSMPYKNNIKINLVLYISIITMYFIYKKEEGDSKFSIQKIMLV